MGLGWLKFCFDYQILMKYRLNKTKMDDLWWNREGEASMYEEHMKWLMLYFESLLKREG